MNEKLNKAVKAGDIESARQLVNQGADINFIFGMQGTPLCAAISSNQIEMVRFLISEGKCDINGRDYDGETPLYLAIRKNVKIAEILIKAGCRLNREDPITSLPPITMATKQGLIDVVHWLVDAGCDVNKLDSQGNIALHHATQASKNFEIILELILAGSKVNIRNKQGVAPIHVAIANPHLKPLRMLLDTTNIDIDTLNIKGVPSGKISPETIRNRVVCNVNRKDMLTDNSALHIGVTCMNNMEATKMLLEAGANPNALNAENMTPLHYACKFKNSDVAYLLLEYGAKTDPYNALLCAKRYMHGIKLPAAAPIHFAVESGDLELVRKMLECGACVNVMNKAEETPLYVALRTSQGNVCNGIVEILIEHEDTDFKILDIHKKNLFHALVKSDRLQFIPRLVELGCPLNEGVVLPLHYAISGFKYDAVQALLKQGADPNMKDEAGYTALQLCLLEQCDIKMAKLLLCHGADLDMVEIGGESAELFWQSMFEMDIDYANLFLETGGDVNVARHCIEEITQDEDFKFFEGLLPVVNMPQPLAKLTRNVIRQYFINNKISLRKVDGIALPPSLKDFITLQYLMKTDFSLKKQLGANDYHDNLYISSDDSS